LAIFPALCVLLGAKIQRDTQERLARMSAVRERLQAKIASLARISALVEEGSFLAVHVEVEVTKYMQSVSALEDLVRSNIIPDVGQQLDFVTHLRDGLNNQSLDKQLREITFEASHEAAIVGTLPAHLAPDGQTNLLSLVSLWRKELLYNRHDVTTNKLKRLPTPLGLALLECCRSYKADLECELEETDRARGKPSKKSRS
jgi:hypothetical protein